MLRVVDGLNIDKFPYENLRLIADLLYFDGPLLSYFKDNANQHYLYYWCDTDESYNRWLVCKIPQRPLSHFLTRQLTLRALIFASEPDNIYLVDMDEQLRYAHIVKTQLGKLPEDYLPDHDTYYDASLSVFYDAQAVREIIVLLQQDVEETKTKLDLYEQAANRHPEAFREMLAIP